MAVGQAALRGTLDVPALNAAETRLEVAGTARCHAHGQVLRQVLAVHRVHLQGDMALATVPQVALLLQLSESAAHDRLSEALLLLSLPGGIQALECGLLNPEQSTALLRALDVLELPVRLAVWRRVQARLLAAQDDGTPLPAHELSRLLSRWIIAADPAGAQDRRRAAEDGGDVSYRRRGDGLGDLFATAVPAPLLQAVLARVRDAARPWGSADERSAGKRRLDALLNLILGRDTLPFGADETDRRDRPDDPTGTPDGSSAGPAAGRRCGSRCGCRLDAPAPCGADVVVHVPLGAALGITDELGELIGHGPLDPQQLAQILLAGPRLRAVHVDTHGIPVSAADQVTVPPRDDPAALRAALLALATTPPGPAQPQHPHDHQPPDDLLGRPPAAPPAHRPGYPDGHPAGDPPGRRPSDSTGHRPGALTPDPNTRPGVSPERSSDDLTGTTGSRRPAPARDALDGRAGLDGLDGLDAAPVPGHAHPDGAPGPYRPPRWLRRLVALRAPRCEWPGCGIRAQFCDFEHDTAWPSGPTCPCNTGPLCRHHHRVKQLPLLSKTRGEHNAVTWTDPTGRSWTHTAQHHAPAPAVRPLPTIAPTEPHTLSPHALAELHADPDLDAVQYELRIPDNNPDHPEHDLLADRLDGDTRWTLDLDDPYLWAA